MTNTIEVDFIMPNDKRYHEKVDTSITVDRMIANFLEKRKLIHELGNYSFMVNSTPLDKQKTLKTLVRHCRILKPNCLIKVKQTSKIKGAQKIHYTKNK